MDLITRALQQCRHRLKEAFNEFAGDDPAQSRMELETLDELPLRAHARLPYDDNAFDWVACHELIETCGSHERQVRLLRELLRVARRGIFVSTANRWHPLARWLRPEREVALVDAMAIKTMVDVLPGRPAWKLGHVRLAGFKSHYFLMVWKGERQPSGQREAGRTGAANGSTQGPLKGAVKGATKGAARVHPASAQARHACAFRSRPAPPGAAARW